MVSVSESDGQVSFMCDCLCVCVCVLRVCVRVCIRACMCVGFANVVTCARCSAVYEG